MRNENLPGGAGAASQGRPRALSDRERAAEFRDYLTMRAAEKLRAAGGTPAQRERWALYKRLSAHVAPQLVAGAVLWR